MTTVRILGLLIGLAVLAFVFARFRRARLSRADFLMGLLFSVSLITVSANPNSVNTLRDMLLLSEGQFSRLIALLIASNVLLWLLLLYTRYRYSLHLEQFDRTLRHLGTMEFRRVYPEIETLAPILVVIPAYNEEENIGVVLDAMPSSVRDSPVQVLVIDDGSADRTLEVARNHGALAIRSPINRGGGAALRLGFDVANEFGAEIAVTMDADGQHLPSEIAGLVLPILEGREDFVIGSRILGTRERDSAVRFIGIRVFNAVIRLVSAVRVSDCSNGFRALRISKLSRLDLRQDQFHTAELIIDAAKKGVAIGEAPVTVKRRYSGESKKGKNWTYGLNFAKTIFKTWIR
jgi:hypothetical protein